MKYSYRYILSLIMAVALTAGLSSCKDDLIPEEDTGYPSEKKEGTALMLELGLQSLARDGSSTSYEDYEDYIDPSKVSLLFFYADTEANGTRSANYNKLIRQFKHDELKFIPIENTLEGTLLNWYVKIEGIDESFARQLRSHNFKVVALVNWEDVTLTGSVYNEDGTIDKYGVDLGMLHHLSNYDDPYVSKPGVYGFLYQPGLEKYNYGHMGLYRDWVDDNVIDFEGKSAEQWLRENWWPERKLKEDYINTVTGEPVYTYEDLLISWNFNAAWNYGNPDYNPEKDFPKLYRPSDWAWKNHNDFYVWLLNKQPEVENPEDQQEQSKYLKDLTVTSDKLGFEFKAPKEAEEIEYTLPGSYRDEINGKIGVVLNPGNLDANSINFNLLSGGKIKINWGSAVAGQDAQLCYMIRDSKDIPGEKYEYKSSSGSTDIESFIDTGRNTEKSQFMTIYCATGQAVIYSIEYIRDEYLEETAHKGKVISKENPIPMYGVQEYAALGTFWKTGTLFNLSDFNNLSLIESGYPGYKRLYLIRSVAKVEVKIPKTFNAHHVYMRGMNRKSRHEPMDITLPTDRIWADNSLAPNVHPESCECNILKDHTPFFQCDDYQNHLLWYYGTWNSVSSDRFNDLYFKFPIPAPNAFGKPTVSPDNDPYWDGYPHILNPLIGTQNFTEFLSAGTSEGIYDRYVLYVPEKFSDDPHEPGDQWSVPDVCHIEFRRGQDATEEFEADPATNLDDDDCFRIYFTKDGYNKKYLPDFETKLEKEPDKVRNWENYYEQNKENLQTHWPIVRNHVYSFIVEDAYNAVIIVKLNVLPWKETEQNNYNW